MVQHMKNTRDDVQSQLVIKEIHYGVDLADDMFTRGHLEHDH
jgi:hypothetical protein